MPPMQHNAYLNGEAPSAKRQAPKEEIRERLSHVDRRGLVGYQAARAVYFIPSPQPVCGDPAYNRICLNPGYGASLHLGSLRGRSGFDLSSMRLLAALGCMKRNSWARSGLWGTRFELAPLVGRSFTRFRLESEVCLEADRIPFCRLHRPGSVVQGFVSPSSFLCDPLGSSNG
ncbi:hypothetical protein VTI28DRAFT_6413 [Corynascus sepedonium]